MEIIDNKLYKYLKNFITDEDNPQISSELKFTISTIIENYLSLEHKHFYTEFSVGKNFYYDGYAPEGMDDYYEPIIFEYKLYRDNSPRNLYKRFLNFIEEINQPEKIIFVVPNLKQSDIDALMREDYNSYSKEIEIWNINKLDELYNKIWAKDPTISQTLDNIYRHYLDYQISKSSVSNIDDRLADHENKIKDLKNAYDHKSIVLFLGAGVSVDANIPLWNNVISQLFGQLMDEIMRENEIELNSVEKEQMAYMLKYENSFSPIIQTRILKTGFRGQLEERLKDLMYKDTRKDETELIQSISNICQKKKDKTGVKAIVTYNFDDLLESSLKSRSIAFESIYSESLLPVKDELGIYHVHGFIPQDPNSYFSLESSNLIFSEEEYHKIMSDPYNWANLAQLEFLTNDICVFIGLSLTDPNLRRILDIASSKKSVRYNKTYHYAFLKRPNFKLFHPSQNIDRFKEINLDLLETFYRESGISIIWFDHFKDLPKLLSILLREDQ